MAHRPRVGRWLAVLAAGLYSTLPARAQTPISCNDYPFLQLSVNHDIRIPNARSNGEDGWVRMDYRAPHQQVEWSPMAANFAEYRAQTVDVAELYSDMGTWIADPSYVYRYHWKGECFRRFGLARVMPVQYLGRLKQIEPPPYSGCGPNYDENPYHDPFYDPNDPESPPDCGLGGTSGGQDDGAEEYEPPLDANCVEEYICIDYWDEDSEEWVTWWCGIGTVCQ